MVSLEISVCVWKETITIETCFRCVIAKAIATVMWDMHLLCVIDLDLEAVLIADQLLMSMVSNQFWLTR